MLPGVDADEHDILCDWVLVCRRGDLEAARLGVPDEPSPAGSLDAGEGGIELCNELLHRAILCLDPLAERRGRVEGLGRRGQVGPEEGVVQVAAAVEFDGRLQGNGLFDVPLCRLEARLGRVQVCDVGLVVLAVVQTHNLLRDGRLEGVVRISCLASAQAHPLLHGRKLTQLGECVLLSHEETTRRGLDGRSEHLD